MTGKERSEALIKIAENAEKIYAAGEEKALNEALEALNQKLNKYDVTVSYASGSGRTLYVKANLLPRGQGDYDYFCNDNGSGSMINLFSLNRLYYWSDSAEYIRILVNDQQILDSYTYLQYDNVANQYIDITEDCTISLYTDV